MAGHIFMQSLPFSIVVLIIELIEFIKTIIVKLILQPGFIAALAALIVASKTFNNYLRQKKSDIIQVRYVTNGIEKPLDLLIKSYEQCWGNYSILNQMSLYAAYINAGMEIEWNKKMLLDQRSLLNIQLY